MYILSLDLATRTGWAYGKKDAGLLSGIHCNMGVENFRKRTGESQGMIFLRFRSWLESFVKENPVELLLYEQSHQRGRAATEMAMGLLGVLKMVAEEYEINFSSVHSATIKKFAVGKGNASKTLMMAAFKGRHGREPIDDNEADAYWLLAYGVNEFN